nr:hypothetical protein HmN_000283700 [Hymenolepis microstoma]
MRCDEYYIIYSQWKDKWAHKRARIYFPGLMLVMGLVMSRSHGLSLFFTSLLVILLGYSLSWFSVPLPLSFEFDENTIYGIIFDAGSTGSRVRIYKVLRNSSDGCQYRLLSEEAFCVNPGLSEFARFPLESIGYLRPLLEQVNTHVPLHKRSQTPLFLRATAGLRLLPEFAADALLESVYSLFNSSGFYLPTEGAVSIMDGIDEGFFAWISLLFLRQKSCIEPCNPSQSTLSAATTESNSYLHQQAIFDLGGASFQVTFGTSSTIDEGHNEDVHTMPSVYIGTQFAPPSGKFFAHSYLGLGLISAMHSMFMRSSNHSDLSKTHHLLSPCFPINAIGEWYHGGTNWTITHGFNGRTFPADQAFDQCLETALDIISKRGLGVNRTHHIDYLKDIEIHAISYMCSITEEVSETFSNSLGDGRVPVQWYFNAAKKACSEWRLEEPFRCAELTYIYALLSYGFGLPMDKYLNLNRTINGVEVGWPVGFLVDVLLRYSHADQQVAVVPEVTSTNEADRQYKKHPVVAYFKLRRLNVDNIQKEKRYSKKRDLDIR